MMDPKDEKEKTPVLQSDDRQVASSGDDISAFLDQVRSMPADTNRPSRGRLVFAMDATMSRQPTWDTALQIQGEMFSETARIGGLEVQLVYFRGFRECRASKWVRDATALAGLMTQVVCRGGHTQIERVLKHVRKEAKSDTVSAVVYVGDCMEEDVDRLCNQAGELGLLGVPMFMFQEGSERNAEAAFREIARLTGGAFCRFDHASAQQLRDLLSAVAVYAAGGRQALIAHGRERGGGAQRLLEQLT